MISVQNHLQRLSGSKIFIFILLGIIIFPSCDIFKPAQSGKKDDIVLDPITGKRKKYNKRTKQYEYIDSKVEKVDTVVWRTPSAGLPPVSETPNSSTVSDPLDGNGSTSIDTTSQNLDTYNVGILLPFLTSRSAGTISSKSKLAIQFYAGVKMALEDLQNQDVNLNVKVYDTNANPSTINNILAKPEIQDMNLILGPVKKNNVKLVAEFGKSRHIPVVSPLSPSRNGSENPYLIQVNPSFKAHCKAIMTHILKHYDADQVVLLVQDNVKEKRRLKYFQDARKEIAKTNDITPMKEMLVSPISSEWANANFDGYINPNKKTVFVIPSWSNEGFINAMVRILRIAKSQNDLVVYGMPQWMKFTKIDYEYFENLNIHVSSANFIDLDNPKIVAFRQRYFRKYDDIPTKYAFQGYDDMMYFGEMLQKYGTQFQFQLDRERDEALHTQYHFQSIVNPKAIQNETFDIDYFENNFVYILEFEDYHFKIAD